MARQSSTTISVLGELTAGAGEPLYQQLYRAMREAILSGRWQAGAQVPSTRQLAEELGFSRSTAVSAYEQLLAEGFLEGEAGSGTFVSRRLSEEQVVGRRAGEGRKVMSGPLSRRGLALVGSATTHVQPAGPPRAFRPGVPALDHFPSRIWERLLAKSWRGLASGEMGYGAADGYRPLREAVASYLREARGVRCGWGQVLIVSGSQQAIHLAGQVLLDAGDAVWMEEPGYRGARDALMSAGARLVAVPVDEDGLNVAEGVRLAAGARMAYVTPSHQYPSGRTMTLERRLELLEWASSRKAWVVEDDYDSEFRYASRPLAALQGLDDGAHVIYVGTFSKVLFPALRMGYLVVPEALVDAFRAARALQDRHAPVLEQRVLTAFLQEGHFGRHIRRMRSLYLERQEALLGAVARELGGALTIPAAGAGLHLAAWLAAGVDDEAVSRRAAEVGVEAPAVSSYCMERNRRPGLVLGYAGYSVGALRGGVKRLARAFD